MSIMKLGYQLAEPFRKAEFVRTGEEPAWKQSLEVETTALTPAQRAVLLRLPTSYTGTTTCYGLANPERIGFNRFGGEIGSIKLEQAEVWSEIISGEQVPAVLDRIGARIEELQAGLETRRQEQRTKQLADAAAGLERLASFSDDQLAAMVSSNSLGIRLPADAPEEMLNAATALTSRANAARDTRDDARASANEAAKAARLTERATWIEEHGSDYLRKAVDAGYSCQRQYVTERAALELPGFVVDFAERAEWKSRSCPTEPQLTESLELGKAGRSARVVWLTREANDENGMLYADEERQAIVIIGYLDRYTLVSQ